MCVSKESDAINCIDDARLPECITELFYRLNLRNSSGLKYSLEEGGATKSRIIRTNVDGETKRSANIWEEGPVYYYSATAYAYLVSSSSWPLEFLLSDHVSPSTMDLPREQLVEKQLSAERACRRAGIGGLRERSSIKIAVRCSWPCLLQSSPRLFLPTFLPSFLPSFLPPLCAAAVVGIDPIKYDPRPGSATTSRVTLFRVFLPSLSPHIVHADRATITIPFRKFANDKYPR